MDLNKFHLKRVNPFQGLIIDADTWRDAHNYHRDQQRLHVLAFHRTGVVEGLKVAANVPADLSVVIQPGIAVDSDGNVIIVSQVQHYRIQTTAKGSIYLVLQFREVPGEPYQPPERGQPTRLLDAYRIYETDKLPDSPYIELARIAFDSSQGTIKNPAIAERPGTNEINLLFRQEVAREAPEPAATPRKPAVVASKAGVVETAPAAVKDVITLGYATLGEASKDLHLVGVRNLIQEAKRQLAVGINLDDRVALNKDLSRYGLLYLTGSGRFELAADQQAPLAAFIRAGGVIWGEGCSEGAEGAKGSKDFGMAFNRLANQLNCKLGLVQRGHSLLSTVHIFSDVPQGATPAMLIEGGNIICSGSDYGCAWQGGQRDQPLPRDVIRSSFEMGINIISYAFMTRVTKSGS